MTSHARGIGLLATKKVKFENQKMFLALLILLVRHEGRRACRALACVY